MGDVISLVAGGDVNVQDRDDPSGAFAGVRDVMGRADIRFVNLEGPLSGTSHGPAGPDIAHKPGWRHSDPAVVAALTTAGVDVVSCANNVTFPPAAAMASLAVLEAADKVLDRVTRLSAARDTTLTVTDNAVTLSDQ